MQALSPGNPLKYPKCLAETQGTVLVTGHRQAVPVFKVRIHLAAIKESVNELRQQWPVPTISADGSRGFLKVCR